MNLAPQIFAQQVRDRLLRSTSRLKSPEFFIVSGLLPAELVVAPIEVWIPNSDQLRESPPTVWCRQPWMRIDKDWHNDERGMCWVLAAQWCDRMAPDQMPVDAFLQFGPRWLVVAVGSLIDRHYFGHYNKLREWPSMWEAFPHCELGTEIYERSKRFRSKRAIQSSSESRGSH